ncbi:hypothetical protein JCM24511_03510 [Saitozyma sp. JCM 24511]|nr:hypothetical protein JCM24511_03510 [Saitozyma sp. JCM 24511]
MAQAGILGNLKYESRNGWAVEFGQALGDWLYLSDPTNAPLPSIFNNRVFTREAISKHLDMHHLVEFTPGRDSFDAIDKGRRLPALHLLDKIVERVQQQDEANRAFLLMGFAARLFEHAGRSADVDGYGKEAKRYIEKISRDSAAIHINSKAVCRILAEPPLDGSSARNKIKRASQPLVVIFIAADPTDAVRLDTLGELADLTGAVRAAILPGSIKVAVCPGGKISELRSSDVEKPTVVHYSGHGTKQGFWFCNDRAEATEVDPAALARLLANHRPKGLRAVVMNACYSAQQGQLLADATGHAVAMQGQLSDSGAIAFTKQFYSSMGAGDTFEEAFDNAADAVGLDPQLTALNPVLFKRVEAEQAAARLPATPTSPSVSQTPSIISRAQADLQPSSTSQEHPAASSVASPSTPSVSELPSMIADFQEPSPEATSRVNGQSSTPLTTSPTTSYGWQTPSIDTNIHPAGLEPSSKDLSWAGNKLQA